MLIDTTIHATEPERVARFLALLWGTEAMPIPDLSGGWPGSWPGSWIAFADAGGSASVLVREALLPRPEARVAITTRLSETAVHALAATETWASRHERRFGEAGNAVGHAVVAVTVEPFLVLEVLPEAMAAARAEAMRPWRWGAMLAGLVPTARPAKAAPALPAMPFPARRAA
ncbi:hypothetical protein [Elioraea sp.]|uniref:hypothetical protein n=1 Tax=Elioraea sp. TaxID=2185103 RepID=UPI0025C15328|nr:hypothetical protein [Elioraea sp.]